MVVTYDYVNLIKNKIKKKRNAFSMGNITNYINAQNNYLAYERIRPVHFTLHYERLFMELVRAYERLTPDERYRVGRPLPQVRFYLKTGRMFNMRTENHALLWDVVNS